jgi:glycosyltransferase involved in cell wall biosynthesis
MRQGPLVLHVPYTFFPDASGGTEVYVLALAQRLAAHGYPSAVAAPAAASNHYFNDGLEVYRFAVDQRPRIELAYGVSDEIAAENFRALLRALRPQIVHLHSRTAAVSELLVDAAHAGGARVVFTYHTPTASCARGTMMLFGEQPCDGVIERRRCTTCALAALGVPRPLAALAASVPGAIGAGAAAYSGDSMGLSRLRIPGLIAAQGKRFHKFIGKVDRVIAVCQWVREVLERNGVPAEKITLSRQGISQPAAHPQPTTVHREDGPLRIAYFGRLDRAKGLDILVHALKVIPEARVNVDIFAIRQARGLSREDEWLAAQAQQDRRLGLHPAVAPDRVIGIMADYDLIAIPSRWLETGPLVALEAFAAGVPVLGADLGGIAELVRDGVDGVLVAPDDPSAWAAAIARLTGNPHIVRELRSNVTAPRSMEAVTDDMATVYSAFATQDVSIGAA